MDESVNEIINQKHIAIVGASKSEKKFGNVIYRDLKEKGYRVVPVNPNADSIDGDPCLPGILSLPPEVKAAVVVTSPDSAGRVVQEAVQHGLKYLWFQRGAESDAAVDKARQSGITVVTKKCIMMYTPPVKGVHSVHGFFSRLFGKY